MIAMEADKLFFKRLLKIQQNEITEHFIYKKLAQREKDEKNKHILNEISKDELRHYGILKAYTKRNVKPDKKRIWFFGLMALVFGITFCIKIMENGEGQAQITYEEIANLLPTAHTVAQDETQHENELISLIDEERLQYASAVIRGLNEALVELTAALSGLTLAIHNTQFIALTGLITGLAMSFSLAGTEYLATKAEKGPQRPFKASLYTSFANLITVALLIYPYFIFDNPYLALVLMLVSAVLIIYVFNFHISVSKELNFKRNFSEMLAVSLGVSALAFLIGYLARTLLHIEL